MIVWLASYPRSGNTFVRILLKHAFGIDTYSMYDDLIDIASDLATAEVVGHRMLPENFELDKFRKDTATFFIKTHDVIDSKDEKVIYIVRDGRASVVSFYHYLKSYSSKKWCMSDVLIGSVPFGSWGEHIRSWNPKRRKNLLLFKFEELTSDPQSHIDAIAEFLNLEKLGDQIPDFRTLHELNSTFFRKGTTDGWKKDLQGEMLKAFLLLNLPQMHDFYPDALPAVFSARASGQSTLDQLCEYSGSINTLLDDLKNERSDMHNKIAGFELKNAKLESRLEAARASISEIKQACGMVTQTKAIRSPLNKYALYKALIDTINNQ